MPESRSTVDSLEKPRKPDLTPGWLRHLGMEFDQPYMVNLRQFLVDEKRRGKVVYPPGNCWFEALKRTDFDRVKVVILGQDPYHGAGQAHGLCFSVRPGVEVPPSLRNIYKELAADVGFEAPGHGCLEHWSDQGVLLLNATLTVRAGEAGSHQNQGWETFTDRVVETLNDRRDNLVFMLWGSYAQNKGRVIDTRKHLVLKAPHPSPLSAHRGFFRCRHFSKANEYLQGCGQSAVDWQLPPAIDT